MKKLLITTLFIGLIGTVLFSFGLIDAGSETVASNATLNTVNGGDIEYHASKQINNFRRSLPVVFPLVGFSALFGLLYFVNSGQEKTGGQEKTDEQEK